MINDKSILVGMPAYRAASTLAATWEAIPHDIVDEILLVDDASDDETVAIARNLGIPVALHDSNRGYGANQKTCYAEALRRGADVVVMLHPDYQYDPRLVTPMASMITSGLYDVVLGSRILGGRAMAGGMPRWKYVANRFLTGIENRAFGLRLSEYHTGRRAYSRRLLETISYRLNSDDFVFDQELIAQVVAAGGFEIDEIAVPTRYFEEASSVGLRRSIVYGLATLRVVARYRLHAARLRRSRKLTARRAGASVPGDPTLPDAVVHR